MPVVEIHTEDLLRKAAEGDEEAFTAIFNHYYILLRPFIRSFTKSSADTEELLQETFIRVWLNRDKLPRIDNLRAWIFTIASRQCLKAIRRNLLEQQQMARLKGRGKKMEECLTPFDLFQAEEIRRLIGQAVEQMPPQRKRIYELSRNEGLKPADIAAELSLSVSTVKNVLSASLKDIRRFLKESGHTLSILCMITPIPFLN